MNLKTLVIGLDGASWNYLKPNLDRLPNLKEIIKNGISGELKSCIPPWSFPAWKCYSTGKHPGKLGIYYFVDIDFKNRKISLFDSTSCKEKEIWDYLGEKGIKVGIINMPMTYPPRRVNGIMISGPFSSEARYTYPKNLENEFRKFNYKVYAEEFLIQSNKKKNIKIIKDIIKSRFEAAKFIIDKFRVSFLHLTIFHIDTVQHFMWNTVQLDEIWILLDREIGRLMDYIGKECLIILMSDHGFVEHKEKFYLNSWLVKHGYLTLNKSLKLWNIFRDIGFSQEGIYSFLKNTGLLHLVRKNFSKSLLRKLARSLPTDIGLIGVENLGSIIDWKNTKAISLGESIYINSQVGEYEKLKGELKEKLKQIKFQDLYIIEDILEYKQIYDVCEGNPPAFYIKMKESFCVARGLKINNDLFERKDDWKAHHALTGILIVKGPGIKKGASIKGAEIVDLTPTILHWMNIPIPIQMDGKVLKGIFDK